MKKKIIFSICIFLIIGITSIVIYTTKNNEVKNTFTSGKVSIVLEKSKETKSFQLLPGKKYNIDSTVIVKKGSKESYVRLYVTVTNIKELNELINDNFFPENYMIGWNEKIWKYVRTIDNGNNSNTYEYHYYESVNGEKSEKRLEPLFDYFEVPSKLTSEDLEKLKNFEISVIAHATQKKGIDNAEEAWKHFDKNN